jgi:hypothetical protein
MQPLLLLELDWHHNGIRNVQQHFHVNYEKTELNKRETNAALTRDRRLTLSALPLSSLSLPTKHNMDQVLSCGELRVSIMHSELNLETTSAVQSK